MIKKIIIFFLVPYSLLILPGISWSDTLRCDGERLVADLQTEYERIGDISSLFEQTTTVPGDPTGVNATGKVFFKRPHLMRWEYEKPERQVIVTSGDKVYLYEIDARQITVVPRDQFLSTRISRAFFFGKGDIRRDFKIKGCRKENALYVLTLFPKRQIPQLKLLRLYIDPDTKIIKKTILEDQTGGKTIISFIDMKVNKGLPEKLFEFSIPKGVDVYNME